MRCSVECYFARALLFRPDDTTARSLYATDLFQEKRAADAKKQLEDAAHYAGDFNPTAQRGVHAHRRVSV